MLARNDTYWRVLAFSFLHISFIGGSIKFFHLKNSPWAGFGQILAVACTRTEKHSCPQRHASVGTEQACKKLPSAKTRIYLNSWIKFRPYNKFLCTSLGRSLCNGNEQALIQNISGHHDCSTKDVFLCTADKLQCWPILARNDTYWRVLAFSFLHISFIGPIASVVLSNSFI